jgi:hypothetical protein
VERGSPSGHYGFAGLAGCAERLEPRCPDDSRLVTYPVAILQCFLHNYSEHYRPLATGTSPKFSQVAEPDRAGQKGQVSRTRRHLSRELLAGSSKMAGKSSNCCSGRSYIPVVCPSLSRTPNRPDECPILAWHFIKKYSAQINRTSDKIPAGTLQVLANWH